MNLLIGGELPHRSVVPALKAYHRAPNLNRPAFTLVEMLVAMSITLLMMAAVITVFANVSESVADRRAGIEMATRLRQARALLQADLANHTCPALTWTSPESNHGHIEIVEGPQSDFAPSIWLQDANNDGAPDPVGGLTIDLAVSQLPGSNLNRLPGSSVDLASGLVTDGGGLGDWDDVLSLTVRNDDKPFVGRAPTDVPTSGRGFENWGATEIESPLAEVVWFAIENPVEETRTFYFGEPGFRTVYRRTMLIAPHLDYGILVNGQNAGPGVLRVVAGDQDDVDDAIAAIIAFQEQYDISVRLEWDPLLDGGRWLIKANTLGDLTKRENRFDHQHIPYGTPGTAQGQRRFPYHYVGIGRGLAGTIQVRPAFDNETRKFERNEDFNVGAIDKTVNGGTRDDGTGTVRSYSLGNRGRWLASRPFVYVDDSGALKPTTRAIVNEDGEVVMFTNGIAPLSGDRRGEDVVLSNMLAFDIKVYDPEAPLLAENPTIDTSTDPQSPNAYPGEVVGPGSAGWGTLLRNYSNNSAPNGAFQPIAGRGAYVDLGYYTLHAAFAARNNGVAGWPSGSISYYDNYLSDSKFALAMNTKSGLGANPLNYNGYAFQPYRTYDTWSTSYENNGKSDDGDAVVDPATNGFDDDGVNGVDDPGERETAPPYDTALRGIQVTLRAYELDSRQIREVNVKQTFMPK